MPELLGVTGVFFTWYKAVEITSAIRKLLNGSHMAVKAARGPRDNAN